MTSTNATFVLVLMLGIGCLKSKVKNSSLLEMAGLLPAKTYFWTCPSLSLATRVRSDFLRDALKCARYQLARTTTCRYGFVTAMGGSGTFNFWQNAAKPRVIFVN